MLTTRDIENFKEWRYQSSPPDLLSKIFLPFWKFLANLVPNFIHPNILSLSSLMCGVIPLFFLDYFVNNIDILSSSLLGLSIFMAMTFDAMDGIHARNTGNSSPIGEFIDHMVDFLFAGMTILSVGTYLGIRDPLIWNFALTVTLCHFIATHLLAIESKKVQLVGMYNPITTQLAAIVGLFVVPMLGFPVNSEWLYTPITYVLVIPVIFTILRNAMYRMREKSFLRTQISLFYVFVLLETLISYYMISCKDTGLLEVLCYKLYLVPYMAEVLMAKMANRFAFSSTFILWTSTICAISYYSPLLSLVITMIYLIKILTELSVELNVSLYKVKKN